MPINKEQALELADKYLLHFQGHMVLRDNITISRKNNKWVINAETIPLTIGEPIEGISFDIDVDSGEFGATITFRVS
jgi:hypothetical protein